MTVSSASVGATHHLLQSQALKKAAAPKPAPQPEVDDTDQAGDTADEGGEGLDVKG